MKPIQTNPIYPAVLVLVASIMMGTGTGTNGIPGAMMIFAIAMVFVVFATMDGLRKKDNDQQTQIDDLKRELEEMKRKE